MSIEPPQEDAELYCTPDDVSDFFQKYDAFLDAGEVFTVDGEVKDKEDVAEEDIEEEGPTNPTRAEVERRIQHASNWIDNYTGHAWRPRRVVDEMKNYRNAYYWRAGMPLFLMKRDIRTPLDPDEGDKLEIWEGGEYQDWLQDPSKEEGRDGDYWVDERQGHLYIYRRRLWFRRHKEVRLSYRYGKDSVPPTIRDAAAIKAGVKLLETQQYRVTTPGNEEAPDEMTVAERWDEDVEEMLQPYKELRGQGMETVF